MRISVVIPCYNKAHVAPVTLQALERQTFDPAAFDVILVDDGSTDSRWDPPEEMALSVRRVSQEHQGAGAARNLGASLAAGDILLFLDADIVLDPEALAVHRDAHERYDRALVVSRVLPAMPDPAGVEDLIFQESFDLGDRDRSLPGRCAITQALSVKAAHFRELGGFAADLPRGQDIEFGYRAERQGYDIRFCPSAIGWHHHALNLDQRCRNERRNHEQLVLLFQRVPQLMGLMPYLRFKLPVHWPADPVPKVAAKLLRQSLASAPVLGALRLVWKVLRRSHLPPTVLVPLFWTIVGSYQMRGLGEGMRKYGPVPLQAAQPVPRDEDSHGC